MYWLVIIFQLNNGMSIENKFWFSKSSYCEFAKHKFEQSAPTIKTNQMINEYKIIKMECIYEDTNSN